MVHSTSRRIDFAQRNRTAQNELERLAEEDAAVLTWFTAQQGEARNLFKRYLSL